MEACDFNPGSRFGVPLSPFPPGLRWTSPRDLLFELMTDLHRGWVQDYLLRPDPSVDARILSSPAHLSKSFSFSFNGYLDETWSFDAVNVDGAVLAVPAFTKDDLSCGLCIRKACGRGGRTEILSAANWFMHYVHNDRTGVLCIISEPGDNDIVEMNALLPASPSIKPSMRLRFDSVRFTQAFVFGSVNFDLLERSIVSMVIGHSVFDSVGRTREETACVASISSQTPSIHVRNRKLSILDHLNLGEYHVKCILSVYYQSVLMKAEPVFGHMIRKKGAEDSVMSKFVFWGVADRLGHLKPVPPAVISIPSQSGGVLGASGTVDGSVVQTAAHNVDNILFGNCRDMPEMLLSGIPEGQEISLEEHEIEFPQPCRLSANSPFAISPAHVTSGLNGHTSVVSAVAQAPPSLNIVPVPRYAKSSKTTKRIAPAPVTASNCSPGENEGTSLVQSLEKERLAKINMRKIRKREAAFKSNEKRKERLRTARLSQK